MIQISNHFNCRTTTNLDLTVPISWWKQCRSAKARVVPGKTLQDKLCTSMDSFDGDFRLRTHDLQHFFEVLVTCFFPWFPGDFGQWWQLAPSFPQEFTFFPWISPWKTEPLWYFQEMPQLRSLWLQGNNVGREVQELFFTCFHMLLQLSHQWCTPVSTRWYTCKSWEFWEELQFWY